jgi:hypothetical protein
MYALERAPRVLESPPISESDVSHTLYQETIRVKSREAEIDEPELRQGESIP